MLKLINKGDTTMKTYMVSFSEPVAVTYKGTHWDKEQKKWVDGEYVEMEQHVTLYSLSAAKKLIKENLEKYKSSSITQTWSDGSWENLGPIKMKGSNKTFVANTRQTKASY